jgi:hypothetical protein
MFPELTLQQVATVAQEIQSFLRAPEAVYEPVA